MVPDTTHVQTPLERSYTRSHALCILSADEVKIAIRNAERLIPRSLRGIPQHVCKIGVGGRTIQQQSAVFPSSRAGRDLVSRDAADVPAFVQAAALCESPTYDQHIGLHPMVEATIGFVVANYAGLREFTRQQTADLASISERLAPVNAQLRAIMPHHIRTMPRAVNVALLHVLVRAAQLPDRDIAVDFVVGFEPVGAIQPSGWYPAQYAPALVDIEALDHQAWHDTLEAQLRASALRTDTHERDRKVWAKTMDEVSRGLVKGPFSREALEAVAGPQGFRAMRRFGVEQNGKVRACDNAKASQHNDGTATFEALVCESADFPARAANAFAAAWAERGWSVRSLWAGTEDMADAYRHLPCARPDMTVFCMWDPDQGRVAYFTLPGFNFGLKSAVLQFNRAAETINAISRAFMGVVCAHYYDDFCVVMPAGVAGAGQGALRAVASILGCALSEEKSAPPAHVVTFLGVQTDLSSVCQYAVQMRVSRARVGRICEQIAAIIGAQELHIATAQSMVGKLHFSLAWCFGKSGRAALQPLVRCARDRSNVYSAGIEAALRFFQLVLPEIPPLVVSLNPPRARPCLVWTDGMWEPLQDTPAGVGFLVAIPRLEFVYEPLPSSPPADGPRGLDAEYIFHHGSAIVPAEMIDALNVRGQQIGQIEILAGIVPYLSLPGALADVDVIHWIDNTSALAALMKGYSGVTDSARLVHIFHAWNFSAHARVWWEYVPTKANPSDLPSRQDLSQEVWEVAPGVTSTPVSAVLPPLDRWSDPAGWTRQAQFVVEDWALVEAEDESDA